MVMFKKLLGCLLMGSILLGASELRALTRSPEKPMVLILLGPPGAGKGTHATPLSLSLDLPHISTGDLFRAQIQSNSSLGQKAKFYIDQGSLVPDDLVLDMLFDRLKAQDCAQGCILDGFPRTLAQAKALDLRLENKSQILALNFHVPDSILIDRIAGRLVCRDCKKSYHKLFDPPATADLCGECGGRLYTRDDDQASIVSKRLEVYREETMPLIDYYAAQNDVLKEVDGQGAKEQVFQDVLNALPSFAKAISSQ